MSEARAAPAEAGPAVPALVLDASVALGWCFEDQADAYADQVLEALQGCRALVPAHWSLEITNVLIQVQKRGQLGEGDAVRFLDLLRQLPIDADSETALRAGETTRTLGRSHGLSAYEAAYLELAMRAGLPLASRNANLQSAARRAGVALFGA